METKQEEVLEAIFEKFQTGDDNIIAVLQDMQNEFGYVPEEAVFWFSEKSGVPASKFYGIITFYAQFHLKPRGKNIITACCGTVCHVKGSQRIISRINDDLKLRNGNDTTRDGMFTLEKVSCIGACSIAPVLVVNQKVHGMMTPEKMAKQLKTITDKKSE